ncbi:hypothetical protein SUGI_0599580 [Cryptomeria japonica]|nr:hypothetical protein SUGI_0599580 [Cryptomeria japonica]
MDTSKCHRMVGRSVVFRTMQARAATLTKSTEPRQYLVSIHAWISIIYDAYTEPLRIESHGKCANCKLM